MDKQSRNLNQDLFEKSRSAEVTAELDFVRQSIISKNLQQSRNTKFSKSTVNNNQKTGENKHRKLGLEEIRKITKKVKNQVLVDLNFSRSPLFGYGNINYDYCPRSEFQVKGKCQHKLEVQGRYFCHSKKLGVESSWYPITKEILQGAVRNQSVRTADSLVSCSNHNKILEGVMQLFARSEKFSMKRLKEIIVDQYENCLTKKDDKKVIQ